MKLIITILLLSGLAIAATTNYDISVVKSGTTWAAIPQPQAEPALSDPGLVWVSQSSASPIELGGMATPFHNVSVAAITASYGKVMIICPGVYVLANNIDVLSNMTIQSLSGVPGDTWLTRYGASEPMFVVTNGYKLFLSGVRITSSNINAGTTGGAIFSSRIQDAEIIDCVFESCVDTTYSVASGVAMSRCQIYNCRSYVFGSITNSELSDCVLTNCSAIGVAYFGYGGAIADSSLYRTKISGFDSVYWSSAPSAHQTWFDVEVRDCIGNPAIDAAIFNAVPYLMVNVNVSGCNGFTRIFSMADYADDSAMMFKCNFVNNVDYVFYNSILSDTYIVPDGSSGIQFCNFITTNEASAFSYSSAGTLLGCSTNNIFHPTMFIDTVPH
jgi:hypothetical protein